MRLLRTKCDDQEFKELVELLDQELTVYDGDEHEFYDQYNKLDGIKHVLLIYVDDEAIACGSCKIHDSTTAEIKRMYVRLSYRGMGYASALVNSLESWAREIGITKIVLETGKRQIAAVHLYKKLNYQIIPNYAPYIGVANSICFEKKL